MVNTVNDLLIRPFSARSFENKLQILKDGKPIPPLPNLFCKHKDKKTEYMRHFSVSQYGKVTWLTGCETRSKLFCWPCLLFSKDNSVWNKRGFSDLNHFTVSQQKHEISQSHINSSFNLQMFSKQRIDTLIDKQRQIEITQHNEKVKNNRELLKRYIDAICYLGKQELPLRGHDESKNSTNKGNYIELLNLIREYDSRLDDHSIASSMFQRTSPVVQNDLIKAISNVMKEFIKNEVKSASFVAIILDETSDVTCKSQLSTVLRFVSEGKIHERFIGFTDVSSHRTSVGLFNHVVSIVEEFQICGKLVGQTYDGACMMSGHVSDLQKKVFDRYPMALFTHCHVLNLILQQALSQVKECQPFFKTLSGLTAYFSNSSKRIYLQQFVSKKLPSVAPPKWNFKSRLINTVQTYRSELIQFFEHIIENSGEWDADDIVKGHGYLLFLQDFQNILLLEIFFKLFTYTDALYNVLQKMKHDILYCRIKINKVKQQLKYDKQNAFEELWLSAVLKNNSNGDHKPKRLKTGPCDDDKEAYLKLFYTIVDSMHSEIDIRYASLPNMEFFQLLHPKKYDDYKKNFPSDVLVKLQNVFVKVFDNMRLQNELKVLYSSPEFSNKQVHELLAFMNDNSLRNAFKEVYKLAELISTLPSSFAAVEHSLSAIKRIKTRYRSTQTQERLCSLSLLAIERDLLLELKRNNSFYDDVLHQFVTDKKN